MAGATGFETERAPSRCEEEAPWMAPEANEGGAEGANTMFATVAPNPVGPASENRKGNFLLFSFCFTKTEGTGYVCLTLQVFFFPCATNPAGPWKE